MYLKQLKSGSPSSVLRTTRIIHVQLESQPYIRIASTKGEHQQPLHFYINTKRYELLQMSTFETNLSAGYTILRV